jgi:hypothetical protein
VEKLLRAIAKKSGWPGVQVPVSFDNDYPLAGASNPLELSTYLEYLQGQRLVPPITTGIRDGIYILSVAGWQAIEPRVEVGGVPGRCFIAMSFDSSLNDAYTLGMKPAIEDLNFKAVCMKEIATNEGITNRILSEIRLAQFVVADFTGQRGGVYFEAGFARGLGREVIWSCRKDELDLVHFDIKHFGHVVWETPADLRTKLAESIRANIIPKR